MQLPDEIVQYIFAWIPSVFAILRRLDRRSKALIECKIYFNMAGPVDIRWVPLHLGRLVKYRIPIAFIVEDTHLPEWFLDSIPLSDMDWRNISGTILSEEFIDRHADRINWMNLRPRRYSDAFTTKYAHRLNWVYLREYYTGLERASAYAQFILQTRTLDINILSSLGLVNWDVISYFHKLTDDFVTLHADKLNWVNILETQDGLSDECIHAHSKYLLAVFDRR